MERCLIGQYKTKSKFSVTATDITKTNMTEMKRHSFVPAELDPTSKGKSIHFFLSLCLYSCVCGLTEES